MLLILNFAEAYQYAFLSILPIYGKDESNAIVRLLFKEKYNASLLTINNEPFPFRTELEAMISRLQQHEPLQYILGYTYFRGLKIAVNPHVLIPRQETEELIELVKPHIDGTINTIADICTGSGCIALSIHKAFPNKTLMATDISPDALVTAAMNEELNFSDKKIKFRKHDILTQQWPFEIPELIICNPPYIAKNEATGMDPHVLQHEPHLALFVEDDDALLFYKSVIRTFLPFTFPKIFFEINPLFSNTLVKYCEQQKLSCEISKDMQGLERFAFVSQL